MKFKHFIDFPDCNDSLEKLEKTKSELLKLPQNDASVLFAINLCNRYIDFSYKNYKQKKNQEIND